MKLSIVVKGIGVILAAGFLLIAADRAQASLIGTQVTFTILNFDGVVPGSDDVSETGCGTLLVQDLPSIPECELFGDLFSTVLIDIRDSSIRLDFTDTTNPTPIYVFGVTR